MPLSVIATPIGNLDDVSARALETLKSVDVLYCEDTRVTAKLLARYEIRVPLQSYREEVHRQKIGEIIALLADGKHVGLVSDAGTPGVSDPGSWLIRDILAAAPETIISPIPGPSAAVAALSISGFPGDEFVFLGFPPHKKGRAAFLKAAMQEPRSAVLYESTHRIEKALEALAEIDPARPLVVCRELTKMHETIYRGTAVLILERLKATSTKGEFVIVISRK
ncbi:16S rRNA (cytidine(1402)-2'-O)-methyltransferase [Candidatus Uhrbacteria bacterium]|nr:16S rRNA (cytidine(1402)-2'-O)-methyltransferase [Candidatus Uhrbacteria bacterium]